MDQAFGRYLLDWEQQRCDEAVADIFGYRSLQLGLPVLAGLRTNRMPQRWLGLQPPDLTGEMPICQAPWDAQLACYPEALPFAEAALDLLVLPHTLELCQEPHAALREAARVLVPEGRLLLFGLNPWSLWGLQHSLEPAGPGRPDARQGIAPWRVRDWLELLSLEVVAVDYGGHVPAADNQRWLDRWRWLDKLGGKAWPVLGGAYCMLAVKKVHGMRLLGPSWRRAAATQVVPAARQPMPQRKKI